jgi:hypothetical protein
MAERLKDREDLRLEALFASAPIEDNGFSRRVMTRVRRQIWLRRLTLPIAFAVGASIAAKPLLQLVQAVSGLLEFIPQTVANNVSASLGASPIAQVPQLQAIVLGGVLLLAVLMFSKLTRLH